jgi:hypothetical protein
VGHEEKKILKVYIQFFVCFIVQWQAGLQRVLAASGVWAWCDLRNVPADVRSILFLCY